MEKERTGSSWVGLMLVALGLILLLVATMLAATMPGNPPDIQGNLSVLVYSENSYLVFVDEMPKPIRVFGESLTFEYNPELEEPQVKIWLKEKEIANKAEIWFRDGDQLREYLR